MTKDSYTWMLTSLGIGPTGREEFELSEGENGVGRGHDSSITLRSINVSRKQCVINLISQTPTLTDLGSTNGTYINGQRINPHIPIPLLENDVIGIGVNTDTNETFAPDSPFLVYKIIKRSVEAIESITLLKRQQAPKRKSGGDPPQDAKKAKTAAPSPNILAPANADNVLVASKKGSWTMFHAVDNSNSHGQIPEDPTLQNSLATSSNSTSRTDTSRRTRSSTNAVPDDAAADPTFTVPSTPSEKNKERTKKSNQATVLPAVPLSFENDILTFSLLSDDEDDELVSSQMFIKCEPSPKILNRSNGGPTAPSRKPVISAEDPEIISDDDEFEDMFDSDEDSFFEKHVSQALMDVSPSKASTEEPSSTKSRDDAEKILPITFLQPSTKPSSAVDRKPASKNLDSVVKKMKTNSNRQCKVALLTEPQTLAGDHASQRILRTAAEPSSKLPKPAPKATQQSSTTAKRGPKSAKPPADTAVEQLTSNGVQKKKRVAFCEEGLTKIKEFAVSGTMKKLPPIAQKEPRIQTSVFQLTGYTIGNSDLARIICDWNLSWFEEMLEVQTDPPLTKFKSHIITNKFPNFEQYCNTMMTAVAHEAWSELQRLHIEQNESQTFQIITGDIMHIEQNNSGQTLIASCKISAEPDEVMPSFGDVVGVLIVKGGKNPKELYNSFGIVIKQFPTMKINSKDGKKIIGGIDVLFRVSRRHKVDADSCKVRVRVYKSGLNWFRYQAAIRNVSLSPLKSVILDPATASKSLPSSNGRTSFHTAVLQTPLNNLQMDAVRGISHSISKNESSISLIHGPPGTGKSTAISALVLQLLEQFKNCQGHRDPLKILLCAPSNTAIDELVLKLLEIRKRMTKEKKFKLTRVGIVKKMHPLVAEVSSESLAKRTISSQAEFTKDDFETEIKLAQARLTAIGICQEKKENKKYEAEKAKIETRISHYQKCVANINAGRKPLNPVENWKLLRESECSVIGGAEIIATTLSSSVSKTLSSALGTSQIGCCIVDEATQATEPEILLPLLHNVKHFVLGGDPHQLGPTILSKFAKNNNFAYSLYHRLMSEWQTTKNPNLYPLRVQYRMHEEIVSFPSEKFYQSQLQTPEYLRVNYRFSPYQVISHSWPENGNEESNDKEARCIVDLVQKICSSEQFTNMSVGVIVPYQQQRSLIVKIIKERKDKSLDGVVVNTIDSFQGQEKDVIILSCVRTKRIGFLCDKQRLNVALTRAKKCLMVIGNFHSLKNEEVWKAMIDDASKRGRLVKANQNDRIAAKLIFSHIISTRRKSQPLNNDKHR